MTNPNKRGGSINTGKTTAAMTEKSWWRWQ